VRNEDTFNRAVATVLARLLDEFPNQIRILDLPALLPTLEREELETWASSIDFLISERVIVGRRIADGAPGFANVGLTRAALQLLNSVPTSLADKGTTTWADRVKAAATFGTKEAAKAVIPPLLHAAAHGHFKL
jgi:hypothetical protein